MTKIAQPRASRRTCPSTRWSRVAVNARAGDAPVIRTVAQMLRDNGPEAETVRRLAAGTIIPEQVDALGLFASDLPDQIFDGVFEPGRDERLRLFDL